MQNLLLTISGPSAVGKKSIMEGVVINCKKGAFASSFSRVVLYNSREKRKAEKDGVDYHFINIQNDLQSKRVSKFKQLCHLNRDEIHTGVKELYNNFYAYRNYGEDIQAIDLEQITNSITLLEIKDVFLDELRKKKKFNSFIKTHKIKVISCFIAPLALSELERQSSLSGISQSTIVEREVDKRIRSRIKKGVSNESNSQIRRRASSGADEVLRAYSKKINYDAIFVNSFIGTNMNPEQEKIARSSNSQKIINEIMELVNR